MRLCGKSNRKVVGVTGAFEKRGDCFDFLGYSDFEERESIYPFGIKLKSTIAG